MSLRFTLPRTAVAGAIVAAAAAMTTGCESTGLSLREHGSSTVSNYMMALGDAAPTPRGALPLPARPTLPMRLAVAQIGEDAPPSVFLNPLKKEDKLFSHLDSIPAAVQSNYAAYQYSGTSQNMARDSRAQVEALCRIAEQMGDDYLFVFGGNIDSAQVRNGLGVLNLTVIGGFFVPSREVKADGRATGMLIYLKTRQIQALVSTQSEDTKTGAAFTEEKTQLDMLQGMRDKLAGDLAKELVDRLKKAPSDGA